jgi:hypothetical protein
LRARRVPNLNDQLGFRDFRIGLLFPEKRRKEARDIQTENMW